MTMPPNVPILELRVAVTTADYERLLKFYTIGLGIEPAQFWQNGQGHAAILNLGRATLEIFDEARAQTSDEIEVGQRVSGPLRCALQVPDVQAARSVAGSRGNAGAPADRDAVGRPQRAHARSRWPASHAVSSARASL